MFPVVASDTDVIDPFGDADGRVRYVVRAVPVVDADLVAIAVVEVHLVGGAGPEAGVLGARGLGEDVGFHGGDLAGPG